MTTIKPFTSKDDIKAQASLWISKIDRGLSLEEKLALQQWAKQSDFYRNSLFSLAAFWDDLSVLNELSALFPLEKTMPEKNSFIARYAIAASTAFILLFAGSLFMNISPFSDATNDKQFVEVRTLQTLIGQQTRFSLSDGSRIKLNTNSLVNVSFSKNNRLLTLIKGEASFDVAKDKSRPFTVTVGEKSFTALGTIFNVQKKSNENMELVVTEGRVLITKSSEPLNKIANMLTILPKEALPGVLITSGEIATIENNTQTLNQKISFEKIQRELAWQQGMLVFTGEPLDEALAEVSRYTTTTFEIDDDALTKIKVAGYFKANDIDGLLKSLSSNFNIQFEKINNTSIRLSLHASK
ncbi:FecR family protein [Colwellia sp. Bg11-12]|jgi:transmembrane sensor|uniref:FecR family protein n=1 Tax=Colwellia sp. Bg11-12 TaxID=2759817 RepID=UPI0015F5D3C0|nr:FecR domain-containing protein [Colwellia sp. Bg11-12]MBA6262537.1 FecR domain-containing protein [Colwellia sp. Bg11-12]